MAGMTFAADADRDGLDDALEQSLLEQFLPRFYVSKGECDASPAEFVPGVSAPRVSARNGTIYGQAFPSVRGTRGRWVELHFYHLWGRDCGRGGHDLDAEHVSALVSEDAGTWRAEYWYAAAHEDTVCDVSMGRKAGVEARAEVWISPGKHASFLRVDSCNGGGCGGDRCETPWKLAVSRVINLGERDAPMPGMGWAASGVWTLQEKMTSDFDDVFLARLDDADGLIRANEQVRGTQTTLAVGYKPLAAINQASTGTGNFLRRATRGVARFLGRK